MSVTRWVVLAGALAACDSEQLNRAPTGNPEPVDMGGPFPSALLEVGDTFSYTAILTRRLDAARDESSQYAVTLTITDVTDGGEDGITTVRYTMTDDGSQASVDWSAAFDFDSIVGRMGPSRTEDTIGADAEIELDGAPQLPEAPSPTKSLPPASTYFIDPRFEADIVSGWESAQAGRNPRVVVGSGEDRLRLQADGAFSGLTFHNGSQLRTLDIVYDEQGALVELLETIGPANAFPRSDMRLVRAAQ